MLRRTLAGRVALILLGLISLITGSVYYVRSLSRPHTGLVSGYPEAIVQNGGVYYAPRTPYSAASAAGMRPYSDRIERVGELTIRSLRDLIIANDSIKDYRPVHVVVERDPGELVTLSLQPLHPIERVDPIFRGIFLVLLGTVAVLLIAAPRLDVAGASMAAACLTYFVFVAVNPFYYSTALSNALAHSGRFTAWLLVAFAAHFPYRRATRSVRSSVTVTLIVLVAGFVIWRLTYYSRWMATGMDSWFVRFRTLGRIANISDGLAYVVFAVMTLTAYSATPLSREKRQLEWVLAGFLIAIPPYFFLEQLPLILGDNPTTRFSTGALANLILLIFPLFFLVGASRGRNIRFRRFLSRYLVVASMIALTLLLFLLGFSPLSAFFQSLFRAADRFATGLAAAALILPVLLIRSALAYGLDRLLGAQRAETRAAGVITSADYAEESADVLTRELFAGLATRLRKAATVMSRRLADLNKLENDAADRLRHSERRRAEEDLDSISHELAGIQDLSDAVDTFGRTPLSLPELYPADRILDQAIWRGTQRLPGLRIRRATQDGGYRSDPVAYVVPQRAVAVVTEILINAQESSPERSVDVSIQADDRTCRFLVRDFGPGPPQGRVFLPFVTSKPGRLGLGLTVARRAVEMDGGSLIFKHADPHGTTAIVTYPSTTLPNRTHGLE